MNPNVAEPAGHRRRPLWAVLLSVAAPGLGHIYCGRLVKGLVLFFIGFVFGPVIAAAAGRAASTFMLVLVGVSLLLVLGVVIYAAVDSARLARKAGDAYPLREYNRWYVYLLFLVVAIAFPANLSHSIREHVLQAFKIPTQSMAPGVLPGDRVLLNKAVYKTQPPKRGDVVIFVYPDDRRLYYIKRLVALPGDAVEIRAGMLSINGLPLERGPADPPPDINFTLPPGARILTEANGRVRYPVLAGPGTGPDLDRIVVPHGRCFVLSDNRTGGIDSRHFGPVPLADIKGRVEYIYWPAENWGRFGRYPY